MEALRIGTEVASAIDRGRAVVALETTLVTHGLPRPEGLETARALESAVRARGALPATIGVLGGRLHVGLRDDELARLASIDSVTKLNLSNLAAALGGRDNGSTTVAATLLAAHRAGIRVFATGGIGGVHRDVCQSGDVSADLDALARFPVAVICSGAKAVLDLPKTVEALETRGVPVLGYRTERFPAFYRRDSGLPVDRAFDDINDLAHAVAAHFELGSGTGVVIANPVPGEAEMARDVYESGIEKALAELAASEIRGRDVTPFLLDSLNRLTAGDSVFSNKALLQNNAETAARLAVALPEADRNGSSESVRRRS